MGEPAQPHSFTSSGGGARSHLPGPGIGAEIAAATWSLSRRRPRNRVEEDLAVLMMDHHAPRPGRDLCTWERVEGVLVNIVAARTVVASERLKRLDRVEDVS
jgi:hypothetical protein